MIPIEKIKTQLIEIPITDITQINQGHSSYFMGAPTDALEQGHILFFPALNFKILPEEIPFFSPKYVHPRFKNISLDSQAGSLRCAPCAPAEYTNLKNMLARFSVNAIDLVSALFPPYQYALIQGRTSFRPTEIAGRRSSYRKDDTRLHVDAFPSAPNQGKRILRVFSNVNLNGQPRHWRIGEPFIEVAKRFLPTIKRPLKGTARVLKLFGITKSYRTEYDHIMLQLHNKMKFDRFYQTNVEQQAMYFPSQSTWVVQTDSVSHAAMSGQHLLEQTFYLPIEAMKAPALSPLRILETLTARKLL